ITAGVNGNLVGLDPRLGPLADNGGPAQTHALLPGSPALDAGSNPLGLATDQRGTARGLNGRAGIGAFQAGPPPLPPAPPSRPNPAFLTQVARRRGKTVVRFLDSVTGDLRLQLRFGVPVRLLSQDLDGDGFADFVLLLRRGRRLRRLAFSGA